MLALVLAAALATDGGTSPVYYRIPAGASLDLHDGDPPLVLPKSYLLPVATFDAVDAELKRLHLLENSTPQSAVIGIPVQGYLIMAAVVASVFLAGGVGIGYYLFGQGHK